MQIVLRSLFLAMFILCFGGLGCFSQDSWDGTKTVTLETRRQTESGDTYTKAAFSFKYGVNGEDAVKTTGNNWDLLFGNSPDRDTFDVTMVVDDRSRIKDLGKHDWFDALQIPDLPAYDVPTREASVPAAEGHIYLVHSCDRDSDHYALFRVEHLETLKNVTISWKLYTLPTQ